MIRFLIITTILFATSLFGVVGTTYALNYSEGTYGTCTYDTCGITLTTGSTLPINVTPSDTGTTCSLQSHSVTATTDSSTGYTVTLHNADATSTLNGPGGNTIAAIGGTSVSPSVLSANTWGYRVDGAGNFGAGPTTSLTNAVVPAEVFAATPSSASAGDTIRTTTTPDDEPIATPVWFGVCVDTSKPAGTYTDTIVFTAVIN